jgi:hypothetical protein
LENFDTKSHVPKNEEIAVNMPQFGLDATAKYGEYALNAPVPDSVKHPSNLL